MMIDNNDNSNNNEIPFWKVMHNKFLLFSILKHVHNTEWTKYEEPLEIHACNRLKFKNITSLGWMIRKKLYTLLKYKIISNEYIYIDVNSIKQLFIEIGKSSKEENNQLIEITKLLYQFKKEQFEICDLTKLSVDSNCLQVLGLLMDQPFNCQIYPSTLLNSIKNSSPQIVEKVIELLIKSYGKLIIDQDTLENSIYWACKNYKYSEEMLKLVVLKHPELNDNIPLCKDSDTKKLSFYSFTNLKSIPLKTRLMELNYVNDNVHEDYLFRDDSYSFSINNITFDELLFKYKVYKYIICKKAGSISNSSPKQISEISELTNEYKKFKQLSKLIILDTANKGLSTYKQYIIKYNESINEFTYNGISDTLHSNNDGSNHSNCLNLLRLMSLQKNGQIYSKSVESIKQIMNSWFNGFKWFPLYSYLSSANVNTTGYNLIINDKKIIDWMFSISSSFTLAHSFFKELFESNRVQVESIELLNYLFSKNNNNVDHPLFSLKSQILFKHTWKKSIQQCDVSQLKLIDSYKIQFVADYGEFTDDNLINPNIQPDKLIELLNYLNQSEYVGFTISIFEKFLDSLLKYQITNPTFNNGNPLELNFQSFSSETINRLISNSASRLNLKMFKLLITNVDKFSIMDQLSDYDFRFLKTQEKLLFGEGINSIYHPTNFSEPNQDKIIEIIEIIQLLSNKLIVCRLNKYEPTVLDSYQVLINYFFEKLIQMETIQSDQVETVWKQLQDNQIEIDHSLYNSFFYLHIRSPKLSKYVMSLPYVQTPIVKEPNVLSAPQYFDATYQYTNCYYHLGNWLQHDKFTFDFIFGKDLSGKYINSFDTILNELIQDLSISPIPSRLYNDFFSLTLNADLQYSLEIKRKDLFFKSLEYIHLNHDKSIYNKYSYDTPCSTIKMYGPLLKGNQDQINHINSLKQLPPVQDTPRKPSEESNFLITKLNIVNYNSFKLTKKSIQLISVILETHEVQKVIETFFHQQGLVMEILEQSIWLNNFELTKFILDNYRIEFKNLNFFPLPVVGQEQHQWQTSHSPYKYDPYLETKLLLENYFDQLPHPSRFEKPLSLKEPFELGLINYCDLILKYYPESFSITKTMIYNTIHNGHIHILKYYFKSFIKPNQDILQCLVAQLSRHSDYKNDLNWVLINN